MRFVDANVFIYILTRSPKDSFEISQRILKRVEQGEDAMTTTAILQEVVDWLEYTKRRGQVKAFLNAVNSYANMHKITASWQDMLSAPEYMETNDLDYVDALTIQVMKKNGISEIYSNDKDFDRVRGIGRIWN